MDVLKIAIAGAGTVGSGLLKILRKNKELIKKKIGKEIVISAIASRKGFENLGVLSNQTVLFKDAAELKTFNDFDILVELIGGEDGVAKDIIFDSINKNKHVVTANKALISKHGYKIIKKAGEKKSIIGFEAAVAGGIPIIKILKEFLITNNIKRVHGILNGTSNYILTKMLESGESFEKILEDAKNLGFAESDPSYDVNGLDTAHKISIISFLSFGNLLNMNSIYVEGIEKIKLVDLKLADSIGYKLKLIGKIELINEKLIQYVYPCLINKNSLMANTDNVYNAITVESDFSNKLFFHGEGAGSYPTATSVLSDIINISLKDHSINPKVKALKKFDAQSIDKRYGSYYLRIMTIDKSGVIAGISKEFKKNNISMKSVMQKDQTSKNEFVTIVLTTHNCYEKDMKNAISKINLFQYVKREIVFYRIEDI